MKDTGHGRTATVKDLIDKLKEYDPEMPVITEGCDCYGNVAGLSIKKADSMVEEDYLLLERSL